MVPWRLARGHYEWPLLTISVDLASGFVFGSAFAVVLSIAERHRKLEDLSLWRVALWAAVGALLPLGAIDLAFGVVEWGFALPSLLIFSGFSSGAVALAKRADRKLTEDDDDLPALEGE